MASSIIPVFGSYIKKLREKRDLKLNEVGFKIKIDPSLLSKYEAGTRFPKKDKLERIASFFNVDRNLLAKKIAKDKQNEHFKKLTSKHIS
jgi:transcriptional regulator with XRE-family HTH domain